MPFTLAKEFEAAEALFPLIREGVPDKAECVELCTALGQ
jgi:hypothetical protein